MSTCTSAFSPTSKRTNDEWKCIFLRHYSMFVSDVDPVMLSDHLIENGIVSIEEWERMKTKEVARHDRCRVLLNHLCLQQNPKAFLVVRRALEKEKHWLLQEIDRPTKVPSQMRKSSRDLKPDLEKTEGIIASLLLLIDKLNQENNLLKIRLQESQTPVQKPKEGSLKGPNALVESKMPNNEKKVKPTENPPINRPQSPKCQPKTSPLQSKTIENDNDKKPDEKVSTNNHKHAKAFWEKKISKQNLSNGRNWKTLLKPKVEEAVEDKPVRCAVNTATCESSHPLKHARAPKEEGENPAEGTAAETTVPPMSPSSCPVIRETIEQVAKVDPIILMQLIEDDRRSTKPSHRNILETAETSSQSQHNNDSTTIDTPDHQPVIQQIRLDPDIEKNDECISCGLIDRLPNGPKPIVYHIRSAKYTILPPKKKKKKPSLTKLLEAFTGNT